MVSRNGRPLPAGLASDRCELASEISEGRDSVIALTLCPLGAFEPRIVLTIPDGWSKNDYNAGRVSLVKTAGDVNAAFATFYLVSGLYADPCAGGTPVAPPTGGAEALVSALRSQPGFEIGPLSRRHPRR